MPSGQVANGMGCVCIIRAHVMELRISPNYSCCLLLYCATRDPKLRIHGKHSLRRVTLLERRVPQAACPQQNNTGSGRPARSAVRTAAPLHPAWHTERRLARSASVVRWDLRRRSESGWCDSRRLGIFAHPSLMSCFSLLAIAARASGRRLGTFASHCPSRRRGPP